ncbi:hypothetical protein Y032_0015g2678 [Ancylostoma ceylanicum]|uniref:Nematode cuticle collagen N-terminal domain-containing protein n=2 Tax=Ancylostoma ceylanicum TaxID=53326 RepID=A0A016V759_9BILA|nr:hypothetical protein Y032_0015g2678 [Ancylostoma ceylanicum]
MYINAIPYEMYGILLDLPVPMLNTELMRNRYPLDVYVHMHIKVNQRIRRFRSLASRDALHYHFISGSYIGCSLMLIVAYCTIYDFFDEMSEFYEEVNQDLRDFRKYANDAKRTMTRRPTMTEREVFEAFIRLKQAVDHLECEAVVEKHQDKETERTYAKAENITVDYPWC